MLEPPKLSEDGTTTYNWSIRPRRGHSALYAGIHSLAKDWDSYHIGFIGQIFDTEEKPIENSSFTEDLKKSLQDFLLKKKIVPVFLEDEQHHGHYEENQNWIQYRAVNQAFADKIKEIYRPNDLVWIHDYHLLLIPRMLRDLLPDAAIGLFIHAPFPSSEIFRCLPRNNCTRILGYESTPSGVDAKGSLVSVGPFPIGIDAERVEKQRKNPEVAPKIAALRELHSGKQIIVGRDKLDLVKGVIQKLHAFEKFLSEYPEWQHKRRVAELIAHINGTYGSLNYTPVHHLHSLIEQDEYYALLSVADIGLITSVRDGMNTTSLEYVMCQQENYGPLILSEFTGMAGSLGAAIMVNPWDYSGVAKAINDALTMSYEEKQNKHMYPESDKWINLTADIDMSWTNAVNKIFKYFTDRTQGSSVEQCQNHLESAILPKLPVEILLGKKNLEVRPTLINKKSTTKVNAKYLKLARLSIDE
ncbi:9200_t:CDS:2 [Racocetra fulgida]|uniref:9200_t:CDS:1 n=1 Tax=Racocetra fulgida TaxID=60492 RepID=A0A9N8Z0L3_9GLOM|nr:9200_t:CDS:2 [Racocetra fulgida]